jgi:hypothetical protein
MPLIIGAVVGLLVVVWAGVEVGKFVSAHPAETVFAVSSAAVIAVSVIAARIYVSLHDRVPLDQPVRGTVIAAAPERPAIRPAPAPRPEPAAPSAPKVGEKCDRTGCEIILDDDPWHCSGVMPDGHEVSGQFCSKTCMNAWQNLMIERHAAPHAIR